MFDERCQDSPGDRLQATHPAVVAAATDTHRLAERRTHPQLLSDPVQWPGAMRHRLQVQTDPREPVPEYVLGGQLAGETAEGTSRYGRCPWGLEVVWACKRQAVGTWRAVPGQRPGRSSADTSPGDQRPAIVELLGVAVMPAEAPVGARNHSASSVVGELRGSTAAGPGCATILIVGFSYVKSN